MKNLTRAVGDSLAHVALLLIVLIAVGMSSIGPPRDRRQRSTPGRAAAAPIPRRPRSGGPWMPS